MNVAITKPSLSSTRSMTSQTAELEKQLALEKYSLRESLATLGSRASDAVDWREHVRKRPVETLGVAAAVGAVLGALAFRETDRSHRTPGGKRILEPNSEGAERTDRSRSSPEWRRLKAGLMGMLADRALVMAREAMYAATHQPIDGGPHIRSAAKAGKE